MRTSPTRWLLSLAALAGALVAGGFRYRDHLEYVAMHTMPPGLSEFKLADPPPVCGRWKDHMPRRRDPEPYRLYLKARNFWRSRIEFEFTRAELLGILADVKLAADKGDWGAKALLAHFYLGGLGPLDTNMVIDSEPEKSVQIVREAVAAGQAWGFYDLGVAHEYGYGGAAMDEAISWAYFKRAAELGSPDAQMALAEAYEKAGRKKDALSMRLCAYNQGHGPAAMYLGRDEELSKNFSEAIKYYQAGTRFGSHDAAVALKIFFSWAEWNHYRDDQLASRQALHLPPDPERQRRYDEIGDALKLNPDLRLSRLDKAVPLPPGELPPWNGLQDAIEADKGEPPTY